jgi:hypothetical protein
MNSSQLTGIPQLSLIHPCHCHFGKRQCEQILCTWKTLPVSLEVPISLFTAHFQCFGSCKSIFKCPVTTRDIGPSPPGSELAVASKPRRNRGFSNWGLPPWMQPCRFSGPTQLILILKHPVYKRHYVQVAHQALQI